LILDKNSSARTPIRIGRWIVSKRGLGHEHYASVNCDYWIDAKGLSAGDNYYHLTAKRFLSADDRKTLPRALKAALDLFGLQPGAARFVPPGCDDRTILARHFGNGRPGK